LLTLVVHKVEGVGELSRAVVGAVERDVASVLRARGQFVDWWER